MYLLGIRVGRDSRALVAGRRPTSSEHIGADPQSVLVLRLRVRVFPKQLGGYVTDGGTKRLVVAFSEAKLPPLVQVFTHSLCPRKVRPAWTRTVGPRRPVPGWSAPHGLRPHSERSPASPLTPSSHSDCRFLVGPADRLAEAEPHIREPAPGEPLPHNAVREPTHLSPINLVDPGGGIRRVDWGPGRSGRF